MYKNFTKMYPVSKTLRFELRPVGNTLQNIEKDEILAADERKAEACKKVKKLMDDYHKKFIEKVLSDFKFNSKNLNAYFEHSTNSEMIKDFEKDKQTLRTELINKFKGDETFKKLFKKEIIEELLPEFVHSEEDTEAVGEFNKFTSYFTSYFNNRKNMYSDEEKSTSIAYRIVDENLPIFILNMRSFKYAYSVLADRVKTEINEKLLPYLEIDNIQEVFTLDNFSNVLTQKAIDKYNELIGGISLENNVKIKGLNEHINEYKQHNKEDKRIGKLEPLYKQILSDATTLSFMFDKYDSDVQVLDGLRELDFVVNKIEDKAKQLLQNIAKYDLSKIYVSNNLSITEISNALYSNWSEITNCLNKWYDVNSTEKNKNTDRYILKRKAYFKNMKTLSIEYLNSCCKELENSRRIEDYYTNLEYENKNVFENIQKCRAQLHNILALGFDKSLKQDELTISLIKNYLDSIKSLQLFIKPLVTCRYDNNLERDNEFYEELLAIWDELFILDGVYNKTRNYVTGKPYSTDKIKLNFNIPTLLDGWDVNKESANKAVILKKKSIYYLAIMNKNFKGVLEKSENICENDYEKMDYKLLPGPNKMLPKVFFADSNMDTFKPSSELLEKYNKGMHKKGANFDLKFCHELIDFFKQSISVHPDWNKFDFKFSNTESYSDIAEFYREVEMQGYKITYSGVSSEYIEELINDGKLYLFQIYNKDFSEYSHGNKNLHTIYWNMVFNEDNLKDVVYKLNGEAELFYRKASLPYKVTHPKNEKIDNKNPDNSKKESVFDYDLVKDKRFTENKFYFHVPITMNFKNKGITNINEIVNTAIKSEKEHYVIGIDRGERHLLYLVLINSKGEIVEQYSLNEIVNEYKNVEYRTNYHDLLDKKEKERLNARQTWQTIENIKELKEGYLSQVINKITDLMVKYNAIVVLEDLNSGFMRGRQKVEKQVYQKFEKMLIDKLNYLVKKNIEETKNGGALNAYQLTNKFESFKKLGKQSGVLFYIPAWNTSKMDPVTGFTNLFYIKYENEKSAKEFIEKFDDIVFNEKEGYFEFHVDYDKFTSKASGTKTNWVICTNSTRIKTFRNPEKNSEWDNVEVVLTSEFKKLFEEYGINIYENLKEQILQIRGKEFYEMFLSLFKLTLQMRNSITGTTTDFIISPVKDKDGRFYDSRLKNYKLPENADANGAFNIARKGLWAIKQIQNTESDKLNKVKLAISNKEWLNFVQNREWEE